MKNKPPRFYAEWVIYLDEFMSPWKRKTPFLENNVYPENHDPWERSTSQSVTILVILLDNIVGGR